MFPTELIFLLHITAISSCVLFFAQLGKEATIAFISILFLLANLFVTKQIQLLGFTATCADAFIIGVSFAINLLQELHGKKWSRLAIWISFATSLFYVIMCQFHLQYQPAPFDTTHNHFYILLYHMIRIISASFISYLIVQLVDTYLYAYVKEKAQGKYLVLRNYISMFSSQLFDTILFSFLGLYGIINNITDIIIVSYSIKVVAIFLTTPFIIAAKKVILQKQTSN